MSQDNTLTIRSDAQIDYCPKCGEETETDTFPVATTRSGQVTKTNTEVKCPEHGTIILG